MAEHHRDRPHRLPTPTTSEEHDVSGQQADPDPQVLEIASPAQSERTATPRPTTVTARSIRTTPPAYRWECACRVPAVLLATYGPDGRMNIKVRDRYWHLYGFGQVQAICPRCGGEHVLDLRRLHTLIDHATPATSQDGAHRS